MDDKWKKKLNSGESENNKAHIAKKLLAELENTIFCEIHFLAFDALKRGLTNIGEGNGGMPEGTLPLVQAEINKAESMAVQIKIMDEKQLERYTLEKQDQDSNMFSWFNHANSLYHLTSEALEAGLFDPPTIKKQPSLEKQ